jgi:hypothetical protein
MKRKVTSASRNANVWFSILIVVAVSCAAPRVRPQQTLDRTVLPIPEPSYPPITELDVRKATPPPRRFRG